MIITAAFTIPRFQPEFSPAVRLVVFWKIFGDYIKQKNIYSCTCLYYYKGPKNHIVHSDLVSLSEFDEKFRVDMYIIKKHLILTWR